MNDIKSESLLEIKALDVYYGPIRALKKLNLEVRKGDIVALLGANGAGKSTVLRAVSGMVRAVSGSVGFAGQNITQMPEEKISRLGIAHVPEGRQIFASLSVWENLQIGAFNCRDHKKRQAKLERCYSYFPILKERQQQLAATLSGGEQQMLAIARGLMSEPQLLLLDEPSLGLAPLIVAEILRIVRQIAEEGVTVLIVEQNASQTLKIADYGYVLEVGSLVAEGDAEQLAQNPKLVEAYLGAH